MRRPGAILIRAAAAVAFAVARPDDGWVARAQARKQPCNRAVGRRDPRTFDTGIEISVSIDGHPAVVVDRREAFWDFINFFARANRRTLDMTIDYGVLQ
jgi:hypothetical protein